jgi:hypothetical protein
MVDTDLLMADTHLFVLVEGPARGDAKFYGDWLLAAAKAESFWRETYDDQDFQKQVQHVCICDFGILATLVLMWLREDMTPFVHDLEMLWLRKDMTRFVLDVNSNEGEAFAMMVEMGFFVRTHQSYQMTIPPCLTAKKVRAAVIQLANTVGENHTPRPESLVNTMPFAQAKALQNRLRAFDKFNRDGAYRACGVTNH